MINTIIAFIKNVKAAAAYRASVNATIKELHRLTDKELNDIGISRGEIYTIAHTSYSLPEKVTAEDVKATRANDNLKGWV